MASLTQFPLFTHPWLNNPSMKRKHSSSPEDSSDDSHNVDLSKPTDHRAKRPRVSTLERGFTHLSIDRATTSTQPIAGSSSHVGGFPPSPIPVDDAMDVEPVCIPPPTIIPTKLPSSQPHLQPSSIEEPDSPPTRDLKMKGTSWYEPEPDRIVVTDLDSSDDEDSLDSGEQPIQVSPALLERIRRRELHHQHQMSVPPGSTALVLYQPLNITPSSDDSESVSNAQVVEVSELPDVQVEEVILDENGMDVEP